MFLSVDFHDAAAFEDEVKFLAEPMMVSLGRLADGNRGFVQGLVLDRGVCVVEKASDGAAVLGYEWFLRGKWVDGHELFSLKHALKASRVVF